MALLPIRLVATQAAFDHYTFLEDATITGILLSNEDTTSESAVLLNGGWIANIAPASGSTQTDPAPVFIPLKIPVKKGFKITLGGTTWCMLYFS